MFLTQFEFNTRRRESRRLLASRQRIHAAVLQGFGDADRDQGRVLWRLDRGENSRVMLLIVSPRRPDLSALVEDAGWPSTQTWRTAEYTPMLRALEAGQQWRFRLVANPVKSKKRDGQDRGRPQPLRGMDERQKWLLDRAESLGVDLGAVETPSFMVTSADVERFERSGSGSVDLTTVQFDGNLQVVDPDRLRVALTGGIGRAKGYGCGLMTLAPVR